MVSKIQQRKRLKGTAKGLGTLIEVSGVDIANQKRLIELLGSDAVKIYKQFNFQFGENVAKDVRKVIPKDSGKLVASVRATKTKQGASFRVGYKKRLTYARLVEFGGSNPFGSNKIYKPKKRDGYFIFPSVRDRLPEMQKDYVRRLNKLVISLYGKASQTGSSRKFGGKT
tara:strand:+ start:160 stop:669 length:510 start_codon:yes stop_codon:yes gene_type:complete